MSNMLPVVTRFACRRILRRSFFDTPLSKSSSAVIANSDLSLTTSSIPVKLKPTLPLYRHSSSFHQKETDAGESVKESEESGVDGDKPAPSFDADFLPFRDGETTIQDVIDDEWNPVPQPRVNYDPIERINLTRGKTGVFEVGELVELLKEEKAYDACVISVPKEMKYVDYLVIVTARSPKHLQAVATFVRRVFKRKDRRRSDVIPTIEKGKTEDDDWVALDLGNIALHIFSWAKREEVDLETLWLVGPEYDDITNQKESDIIKVLGNFSANQSEAQKSIQS